MAKLFYVLMTLIILLMSFNLKCHALKSMTLGGCWATLHEKCQEFLGDFVVDIIKLPINVLY